MLLLLLLLLLQPTWVINVCVSVCDLGSGLAVQESWAEAIKEQRSELSIRAHLEGNLKLLKPITGEGVYNKLAADIRTVRSCGGMCDV